MTTPADPDDGLRLKPSMVARLRASRGRSKDELLTREQMDKQLEHYDLDSLTQRLAEVRRRVIVDFHTGTGPDAAHYGTCRLCDWTWVYGTPELHEPSCPMGEKP